MSEIHATATAIRTLAESAGIAYAETALDVWAGHVTRLSGDSVTLDDVELLLLALQRAGRLSRPEALRLQCAYLREQKAGAAYG